jgi:stage IV sporulation protein FB
MRDLLSWNLSLGRWAGVQVRLHVLFLLLGVFVLHATTLPDAPWPAWYAVTVMAVFLISTLVHELGHAAMAVRLGGRVEQIVLWPFGGLVAPAAPPDPRTDVAITLGGPMGNALICAASLPVLVMTDLAGWQLLNPLVPPSHGHTETFAWDVCLSLVFWLNWVVLLVNLLPALPLDGGRLLRAGLRACLPPRASLLASARVAQLASLGLWLGAWAAHNTRYDFAWIPLLLLGGVLFFSAQYDLRRLYEREEPAGFDLAETPDALSVDSDSPDQWPLQRWLEERREARVQRQRQIEAEEELRVDAILARLHEVGRDGLAEEERALLDRVSARYRNRLRHTK